MIQYQYSHIKEHILLTKLEYEAIALFNTYI